MKKYKALSLFSGAGGDTVGLQKAGFEVDHYVEFDASAIKTHEANFKNCTQILSKSGSTSITDIEDETFKKLKGKVDIIFAGFPCQGFSHAGKKIENDERNQLFYEFVRAVKIIQPRWIIGENVKGLLDRRNGWETNFAELINKEFEKIGYKMIDPELVNTADYGVPQRRSRVFFVGNRMDIDYEFPKKQNKIVGLEKILEKTLDGAVKISIKDFPYLVEARKNGTLNWIEVENEKITGKPHKWLLKSIEEGLVSWDVRKSPHHVQALDINKPSKTIHSGYARMPRLFVLMKMKNQFFLRGLTINELKQIQSFPKNFDYSKVSHNQAIKQIGNAVPPEIVKRITLEIKKQDKYFK